MKIFDCGHQIYVLSEGEINNNVKVISARKLHCWWPEVPDVYRRLISQKVSVSRNLSQKVIPSDIIKPEGHKNFYFWSYYHQEICPKGKTIYFRCDFFNSAAVRLVYWSPFQLRTPVLIWQILAIVKFLDLEMSDIHSIVFLPNFHQDASQGLSDSQDL